MEETLGSFLERRVEETMKLKQGKKRSEKIEREN
jgi:hypothetical protein